MKKVGIGPLLNTLSLALLVGILATGCTDPVLGPDGIAVQAPTVTSVAPADGAVDVPVNTSMITASFSEPVDPATLNPETFSLACPLGTPITGTVAYAGNGNVATFSTSNALPANVTCTATLSTGVQDAAGTPLGAPFVWTFGTGAAPDTTAPTVAAVTPPANATNVALNTLLTASFSEAMNPQTLTPVSFTLACPGGTPVTGTVAYAVNGNTATFSPAVNLPAGVSCTASISTGAQDVSANGLANPFTWSFMTGAAADTTPPTVTAVTPLANATGVARNSLITASFSEAMDPLSLTATSFTLACPARTPVTGTVAYASTGNVATFTPMGDLPASTSCTATLTSAARDAAGNAMVAPFTWTFVTGMAADATAPTVISMTPANGATAVLLNALVVAGFSEVMDPLTLTPATFSLACPAGTPITATVAYAVNGNAATLTPSGNLPPATLCSATVSTGARDVAGNALLVPATWSFTTGAAMDTTPPMVTSSNPADGAAGVCINKTINVLFSEAMDPLTITTATFTLAVNAGPAVTGVVAYDAPTRIASFDPVANLIGTPATTYTATITGGAGGVKDLQGNALTADRFSSFTTAASSCATGPALGAAAPFGAYSGATVTNDGLATIINGDVGVGAASTTITGLRDSGGNIYTLTPDNNGLVNGLVHSLTAPPGSVAGAVVTQARVDAQLALTAISPASLPGGIDMSSLAQCPSCGGAGGGADELGGRTLPPGIYLSSTGTFDLSGPTRGTASLTLDGGGDANAVWVFQAAAGTGTLTVGLTGPATPAVPIQVLLINGAQAKNVFWHVPAGATLGTGSTVVGTLLADAAVTLSTTGGSPPTAVITTLNGRAISLTAGVTMTNAVINVPAP